MNSKTLRSHGAAERPAGPNQLELVLVVLIAAHSYLIGLALFIVPRICLQIGGWEPGGPIFFVKQAGAFHLVVATGYLIEYFRHQTLVFLIATKSIAVVFLLTVWLSGATQWAVLLSAVVDGAMILLIALLRSRSVTNSPDITDRV